MNTHTHLIDNKGSSLGPAPAERIEEGAVQEGAKGRVFTEAWKPRSGVLLAKQDAPSSINFAQLSSTSALQAKCLKRSLGPPP